MPPRQITLLIVACWLAATGWLAYREVLPRFRSDEPPGFTVDLADESGDSRYAVDWTVKHNDREKRYYASTRSKLIEAEDAFEVRSTLSSVTAPNAGTSGFARLAWCADDFSGLQAGDLRSVDCSYRVGRNGAVQFVLVHFRYIVDGSVTNRKNDRVITIEGRVDDGQFTPQWSDDQGEVPSSAEPVAVSALGGLLDPLRPLNRVAHLRPGQRWRCPMNALLLDARRVLQNRTSLAEIAPRKPPLLDAVVRLQVEEFRWKEQPVPCYVIDYDGGQVHASVWVRESDAKVLRQEVTLPGQDRWELVRVSE